MILDDMKVEKAFVEPGLQDNADDDPYGVTSPQNIMKYLKGEDFDAGPTTGRQLTLNLSDGVDSKATMS